MHKYLIALLLSALSLSAASFDGPPSWYEFYRNTNAIPSYPVGINLANAPYNVVGDGTTDWYSTINTAVGASSDYTALIFPIGDIVIRSTLSIGNGTNKRIALRGAGMDLTHLKGEVPSGNTIQVRPNSVLAFAGTNFISGGTLAKGATSATLATTPVCAVGDLVRIGQTNDFTKIGGWLINGTRDPGGDVQTFTARILTVAGNNITFTPQAPETYTLNPYVKVIGAGQMFGAVGVEDMTVTLTNKSTSAAVLFFSRTTNCWALRVKSTNFWNRGISVDQALNTMIEECDIGDMSNNGSSAYCIQASGNSTGTRIANNIIRKGSSGVIVQYGACYTAILYNFFPETWPKYWNGNINSIGAAINLHGGASQFTLIEGNRGNALHVETTTDTTGSNTLWSGGNYNYTVFRNWFTMLDPITNMPPTITQSLKGIAIQYTNKLGWIAFNHIAIPPLTGYAGWNSGEPTGYDDGAHVQDTAAINQTNLRWVKNKLWYNNTLSSYNGDTYNSPPASLFYLEGRPSYIPAYLKWPVFDENDAFTFPLLPAEYRYYGLPIPSVSGQVYFNVLNGGVTNTLTLPQRRHSF